MNKCILTGRITKDLELRHTTGERAVCNFTIAVNERATEDVDFIDCEVWGKTAENLVNYQSKGSLIAVIGRLKKKDYTDKENNKRNKSYVVAEEIEFLEKKSPAKSGQNEQKLDFYCNNNDTNVAVKEQNEAIKTNPYEEFGAMIDEEDIPF